MAESPFLKYQDKNNDGLIDICETGEIVPTNNCPPCKRNPSAIVPQWKNRTTEEPWFNEKYCVMQCTVVTPETDIRPPPNTTSDEHLIELFAQYQEQAIVSLLDKFGKAKTSDNIETAIGVIDYTKYYMEARPSAVLKLLYSIPVDDFALLTAAEEEEEEEEQEETDAEITVKYAANEMFSKLMKFRKAMYMYSRYYRVYTAIEGGLYYFEDGSAYTHAKFDRYGDPGFFVGNSTMADILKDLDNWLNDRGYNIFGVGGLSIGRDRVTDIEFTFNSEYALQKLKVWSIRCGNKPTEYGTANLNALITKNSFKDPTAMAYFTKLEEMESTLSARTEQPWTEFVEKYTYPKVSSAIQLTYLSQDSGPTALSCVGDALAEEGKQLGQDIVDDIFSIGDAVAYAFHKAVCKKSLAEIQLEQEKYGLVFKSDPRTGETTDKVDFGKLKDPKTGAPTKIGEMALSQAYEKLEDSDNAFVQMCAAMLGGAIPSGGNKKLVDDLWRDGLSRIKLCGLMDLTVDAIQCLFKGLSLEQALNSAIKAALNNMAISDFGSLFVGLPPDRQAQLDALVQKKLSSTKLDLPNNNLSNMSEAIETEEGPQDVSKPFGKIVFVRPWEDEEVLEEERKNPRLGNYNNEVRQAQLNDPDRQRDQRTLAQQFDDARGKVEDDGNNLGLNKNSIMQAYILALIQTYSDDLLSLVDALNQYPGAQIIAKVIAVFDCPRPPMFDPNFLDFIKSVDLPFCRDVQEIKLPHLDNPLKYIADIRDIVKVIYQAFLYAVQRTILSIVFRILVKVCEVIGSAICKALEITGDLVGSIPAMATGRTTAVDVINEAICGGSASKGNLDATIGELFEKFGVGGAAFSETEAIKSFLSDLSSATTTEEMLGAFTDEPSQGFLDAGHTILVNQYPQFADAISSKQDLADLFGNIGKVFPTPFRDAIDKYLKDFPDLGNLPANPSLCATPEDLEKFKNLRCMVLDQKASQEQCQNMFDGLQNDLLEDLDELTNLMQGGVGNALEDALHPLVSSPGCDDGLLPFEPESAQKVASTALSNTLEQLKVDFSVDMLGNGGIFADDADWGFMNMVLADTRGRPLSAHRRHASNRANYVDFNNNINGANSNLANLYGLFDDPRPTDGQRGAFPAYVAEHLFFQLNDLDTDFNSDNTAENVTPNKEFRRTFMQLGFNDAFGTNVDLLTMPDFGYNTRFSVDMSSEEVVIKKGARKTTPDISLKFYDNNHGREQSGIPYEWGFEAKMFLSDIQEQKDENGQAKYVNRLDDNTRIILTDILKDRSTKKDTKIRKYEFLSVDDTLDNFEISQYPNFSQANLTLKSYIPQVLLLGDLLGAGVQSGVSFSTIKDFHDSVMSNIFDTMRNDVAGERDTRGLPTKQAWLYGAVYDDLTEEDITYVVKEGQTVAPAGTEYSEATVDDGEGGRRNIENDDMILGISKMQLDQDRGSDRENRVFYLDPKIYGGSYQNPSLYIKPVVNKGWLGMVNVIFPEIGPCKPQQTDLVDFGEIADEISSAYTTITEDQRLKQGAECAVEKPYNRILERASKAGIQGMIKAAARIYSSTHFIKALATFTTFDTSVKENYSSLYASYVVERMEKDFKDATYGFLASLSPFSDQEFWYSFLEQAVQTYGRLVDGGVIVDPPGPVLQALFRLNDAQENYNFPFKSDLKRQKKLGRARDLQTLKSWRNEKNLDTIQATEEDAKLVLKEFVRMELNEMAIKFNENLKQVGIGPQYKDLNLYFLNKFTQGAESLDADKEIVEQVMELPTEGNEHYTNGSELALPDGTPYVGYYHVHENENGDTVYMVGERHSPEPHEELTLFANKVSVPIGDIMSYGAPVVSSNFKKPFVIRKYIKIDGTKMNPDDAVNQIKANTPGQNISDIYPGTLEHVYAEEVEGNIYGEPVDDKTINESAGYSTKKENILVEDTKPRGGSSTRIVGLKGELGVRYGLEFSVIIGGTQITITDVEIDALDLKVENMAPLEANSKLLLCLVNNLKDDELFKILTRYIFPLNKVTAMMAIYNDRAFLPSIGQVSVERGKTVGNPTVGSKPGIGVYIDDETGKITSYSLNAGWEHYNDRTSFPASFTPGIMPWDDWDKKLLRQSRARIKKIFRTYYNSRDFDAGDNEGLDAAKVIINNLKAAISFPAGTGLVPWWRRNRMQRNTPFNAKGELCPKKK